MIPRFLALLFAVLAFSSFANAEAIVNPDKIISGDEIALKDGRVLRLKGIKAASPKATIFLQSNIPGHDLTLQDAVTDRYGRVLATVFLQGQTSPIEDAMLREGVAFVYPAAGDDARLEEMLGLDMRRVRKNADTGPIIPIYLPTTRKNFMENMVLSSASSPRPSA